MDKAKSPSFLSGAHTTIRGSGPGHSEELGKSVSYFLFCSSLVMTRLWYLVTFISSSYPLRNLVYVKSPNTANTYTSLEDTWQRFEDYATVIEFMFTA